MLAAALAAAAWNSAALAQERDTTRVPTGVRIGLLYEAAYRPKVAVRPFQAADPRLADVAVEMHGIVRRDLDYSDRFEMGVVPPQLARGDVDYGAWNALGVVFVVTAEIEAAQPGYRVRLALHDVVYGQVKDERTYRLPPADADGYRMSVHALSDEIVRWATGHPGKAASRVAFTRPARDGGYELMVVDSDGENLRRVLRSDHELLSPAWSPDGRRIVFSGATAGQWEIREVELATGRVSVVASRTGWNGTPRYSPDGQWLAVTMSTERGATDIFVYDMAQRCCLRRLTRGPRADLSPTYSPDGQWLAFNSDRLGAPHIYAMRADGGEATLLTRFVYGESGYYTSPDWSPTNSLVAFHGRSRGSVHIMVADANRPGATVQQITQEGRSEDPSWAPDGRHLVFTGVRGGSRGLFVIDTVTGRLRPLVLGGETLPPDWSPALVRASALETREPLALDRR